MPYQAPGLFSGGEPMGQDRARTEVLAQAFDDAAGGYFQRLKQYEDNIAEAEARIDQMKQYGAGAVVVGILIALLGFTEMESTTVAVLGFLTAVFGGLYAYIQIGNERERIEDNHQKINQNEPDGEVTFVSHIGVPLYLVPYQNQHMIFDGLNTAAQTTVDLASIDGDALIKASDDLKEIDETFREQFDQEGAISPDVITDIDPDLTEHRTLEKPIIEQFDRMTEIARDVEKDEIDVNIHTNNSESKSVKSLTKEGTFLRSNGDLPLVETEISQGECEEIVDRIRGVEQEARSGDLLEQSATLTDRVEEIADSHIQRLQRNRQTVETHFSSYADSADTMMKKYVCEHCYEEHLEEIVDELSLVNEILEEGGSLGRALGDEDLDRGTDEQFTARIERDIRRRIPELDEKLQEGYNSLEDLGKEGGFCKVHQEVDTVAVAQSGTLFGEVWRSLYYEYREPIMDSVKDMEKEAEEVRQNKEQKMIDLTQYEQIKDNLEREYEAVEADYETAKTVENQL